MATFRVEEGEDKVQLTTEHHGGHLHAKNVKIKSNSIQNEMEVTCMKKRVMTKSNSLHNSKDVTFIQRRVRIKSRSIQNARVV